MCERRALRIGGREGRERRGDGGEGGRGGGREGGWGRVRRSGEVGG